MKTLLKLVAVLLLVVVLLGAGGFAWAKGKASDALGRTIEVHQVDFPIPFPLDSAEIAEAGFAPEQADSAAMARAVERGRHLVESRYVCAECHGANLGGGVMVDDPLIGRLLAPNITTGTGSKTVGYTPADWDRIVRHGVKPDGRPSAMPSEDFQKMTDEELSDVVAFVRSHPPVDNEVPPVSLGPLGTVLLATGQIVLSADKIAEHAASHTLMAPEAEPTAAYGAHLANVCTGCHNAALTGGKVPGGDPSWPAAANLTPHEEGLGAWSYEQFVAAMREGVRPDGTALAEPMMTATKYTRRMTDIEMEALWAYLRTLPAAPTPQ